MRTRWGAVRRVWQRPTFASAATATLALGIAAPTALFAVLYATLLRPLPYRDPGNLYTVRTRMIDDRFTSGMLASEEMSALRRASPAVVGAAVTVRRDDVRCSHRAIESRQVDLCRSVGRVLRSDRSADGGRPALHGRRLRGPLRQPRHTVDAGLVGPVWRRPAHPEHDDPIWAVERPRRRRRAGGLRHSA